MEVCMDSLSIRKSIDEIYDEIVTIRRDIHMHPELSEHEERTENAICSYLDKLSIEYEKDISGHGVIARIGKKDAEYGVAIRADIDALPIKESTGLPYASANDGVMHACGHDIHTAILLGTAKLLKGMENELKGAVKLFFQPAEETTGGAAGMIQHDGLNSPRITRVLSLHVDPNYPTGTVYLSTGKMNASTTDMSIKVKGVACHGAHPDKGIDAIVAASHIVLALQTISSRFAAPTTPVIVTIGTISGGSKENVIAGEVELKGTIRALDFETRDFIKAHIKTIAENTAAAFGACAEVSMLDGYPPLVNDKESALTIADIARKELGESGIVFMEEPSLGADDFAYFTSKVRGVYFNIGTYKKGQHEPQMLHNEFFSPDEECIKAGILMEVLGTLKFLDEDEPGA